MPFWDRSQQFLERVFDRFKTKPSVSLIHPDPVSGSVAVPWEPLGQIAPGELPTPSEKYPAPWTHQHRGNGHVDVFDSKGRMFAHVFLWDSQDWDVFNKKLATV